MKWHFALLAVLSFCAQSKPAPSVSLLNTVPLHFEPSLQAGTYEGFGLSYNVAIDNRQMTLNFNHEPLPLRVEFVAANAQAQAKGAISMPGLSHYLTGSSANHWRKGVPHYARVAISELYRGIDLIFYGNHGELEFDFRIRPGSRADKIQLDYHGADSIQLDDQGNLLINKRGRQLLQKKPFAYQWQGDDKNPVEIAYRVNGNNVSFSLGNYQQSQALIIDPVISFSSYLGNSMYENASSVTADQNGNIYRAGASNSPNLATTPGAFQEERLAAPGQSDSYIVKIDGATNTVVYSTYLSGNGDDLVADIAVDASGRVYITGKTSSSDFPGANPVDYQGDDVFVARLSADGSAVDYAEYYGGSAQEYATAITIDNNNNASISGFTNSNVSDHQFVLINSLQSSLADNNGDGFVAQFDSSGNLTFSSYLGGSGQDEINDIAADNAGNLYVVGGTFSADFPVTAGAYQTDGGNLSKDAIVTKINTASPAAIIYSTFIGGSGEDSAYSLAVNSSGEAFVGGYAGVGLPMINALQPNHGGGARDGFIAKLNSAGSALQYSSFLGGFSRDSVRAIALDSNGDILIAGRTESANFPRMGPFQINLGGGVDGFVSKLSGDGTPLKFSSFIGGSENESLSALALDSNDNLVVVGVTHSADFPLTDDAIQSEFAQGVQGDLFAGRITNTDASTDLSVSTSVIQKTYSVDEPLSFTISVANHGPDTATDVSATFALPANTTYQSMSAPGFLCQLTESGYTCSNAIIKADSIADIVLNLVTSSEGSAVLSVVIDNSTEGDTNSENNTASATVSISNENNSTTPPEEDNNDVSGNNNSSSSGGGGSVNLPLLITLLVLAIGRYKSFAADGNKRQVLTRQQH